MERLAPIRVNVIRPGWVDTPFLDEVFGAQHEEILAAAAETLLVKRIGRFHEIADAVFFTDEKRIYEGYCTGCGWQDCLFRDASCV